MRRPSPGPSPKERGIPIADRRDAEETRARILEALKRIVLRDGLGAVGINALAREAGCDKVLIYRYFGDLDGVYSVFAEGADFWWTVEGMIAGLDAKTPATEAFKILLRRHAEAIRARPVTLAVLAAETTERTPLVIALETVREKRALALADWIVRHLTVPRGIDVAAIMLLLSSALTYLAMRARKIRVMSGIEIKSDDDWQRLLRACDALVESINP